MTRHFLASETQLCLGSTRKVVTRKSYCYRLLLLALDPAAHSRDDEVGNCSCVAIVIDTSSLLELEAPPSEDMCLDHLLLSYSR